MPENVTLPKLHVMLQWAMGWSNSHLHEYEIARQRYGIADDEWPTDEPGTAGENACPPEDVGGPHSYGEFLDILKDPKHQHHADMVHWVGGAFDPAAFRLTDVNERLATIKV